MFSLICAWTNPWVNDGDAGDFRRHYAHFDVIVLVSFWRSIWRAIHQNRQKASRSRLLWMYSECALRLMQLVNRRGSESVIKSCPLSSWWWSVLIIGKKKWEMALLLTFTTYIISPYWHDRGFLNLSTCKTKTHLFNIVNIIGADILATQRHQQPRLWLHWTKIILFCFY